MAHLEVSCFEDHHTVENHRQVKPESSLVSAVVGESSHQIGQLEDDLCPTMPDVN